MRSRFPFLAGLLAAAILGGCGDSATESPTTPPAAMQSDARETAVEHLRAQGVDVEGWRMIIIEDKEKYDVSFREPLPDGAYGHSKHVVVSKVDGSIIETYKMR